MQRHGARQDELVVIYDTGGMASAARAWWMLSVFSFRDVRVLDGGLPAWRTAGLPVVMLGDFSATKLTSANQVYDAMMRSGLVIDPLGNTYKNIWPLGADFEPHWCLVLSLDTRLAAIT